MKKNLSFLLVLTSLALVNCSKKPSVDQSSAFKNQVSGVSESVIANLPQIYISKSASFQTADSQFNYDTDSLYIKLTGLDSEALACIEATIPERNQSDTHCQSSTNWNLYKGVNLSQNLDWAPYDLVNKTFVFGATNPNIRILKNHPYFPKMNGSYKIYLKDRAQVTVAIASFNIIKNAIATNSSDISIDGRTLPNPSKLAFDQSSPGGGADINAYAMNPSRCIATPAINRSWQHNINLTNYKSQNAFEFIAFRANESLSLKFTVGTDDASGGFIFNDATNAAIRPSFITISEQACDFDVNKVVGGPNPNSCYVAGINGNSLNWANITGPLPGSYCRLIKGKTYYMNIRMQDARPSVIGGSPTMDSCTNGALCGGVLQIL